MSLFDKLKKKYNKNPKDNTPQRVYGVPNPNQNKRLDDKYNVKPENNHHYKVYGVPDPNRRPKGMKKD